MSDEFGAGDVAVATATTSTARRGRAVSSTKRKTVVRGGARRGRGTSGRGDESELVSGDDDAPGAALHAGDDADENDDNNDDGENNNDENDNKTNIDDDDDDENDNDNDDDADDDDDNNNGDRVAKRRTVIAAEDDDGPYNQRASKRKALRSKAAGAGESPLNSPLRGGGGGGKEAADADVAKGLRHFSLKVCRKVEAKGTTNYAEVADELVAEYKRESEKAGAEISFIDQKNIRRRVYDALNVLRAMNVITKIKKAITWVGLPSADPAPDGRVLPGVTSITAAAAAASSTRNSAAIAAAAAVAAHNSTAMLVKRLAEARDTREAVLRRIQAKRQQHEELMAQQIWYRNLLSRNKRHADELLQSTVERVTLPFIVLNTRADTVIKCQVSPKQTDYFFSFSDPFEIHDDNEILKRMHQRLVLVSATPQPPASQPVNGAKSTFEQQLPTNVASTSAVPPPPPPQFPRIARAIEHYPTAIDEDDDEYVEEEILTANQVIMSNSNSNNSNNSTKNHINNNSNAIEQDDHPQAMSGVQQHHHHDDAGNALLAFANLAKASKAVSPDGAEAVAALVAASLSPKSQTKQRRLRLNE